jgi:hypothetical protein
MGFSGLPWFAVDPGGGVGKLASPRQLVALSVDDEATTADLIAKRGLTFPVGFGADARAVADLTGAFVNPDRSTCSPPASSSTRRARSWSASTPAGPSAG